MIQSAPKMLSSFETDQTVLLGMRAARGL